MAEINVTVTMNPFELVLFRRALAKAADDHLLDRTWALQRICALDVLRWNAEEKVKKLKQIAVRRRRQKAA
jgi:hypothetical protein